MFEKNCPTYISIREIPANNSEANFFIKGIFKMNRALKAAAISAILASTSNQALACLSPHSWTWWNNTAYDEDLTSGPGVHPITYTYALTSAYPIYLATALDAGIGPNGEGKVTISNFYYGALFAEGWTRTWSGGLECTQMIAGDSFDAYNCNDSTYRANRAHIYMNDYAMAGTNQTLRTLA
ncbi:MAG: hypothetical protein Q8L60_15815, partial [Gammaproteobacteria bacterium]|nr:hypothetical protein [Gammaproteobacteria bacterium]